MNALLSWIRLVASGSPKLKSKYQRVEFELRLFGEL